MAGERSGGRLDWASGRLSWWLAAWALGPLLLGVALNLWVNPFRLYWSQAFPPATANTRLLKYELLLERPAPPRVLIMGSSRVMTMPTAEVERLFGGPAFNYGVPSAMAEDYYAALRLVNEEGRAHVESLILGIDYTALHPALPLMHEARYFAQYRRFMSPGCLGPPLWLDRVTMVISAEQTEESMNVLRRRAQHRLQVPNVRFNPDGSGVMVAREQAISAGRFDLERILSHRLRHFDCYSLNLATYSAPSAKRLGCIRRLLDYCRAHGIRVHAYLTPLHPRQWELLDSLPEASVLAETNKALTALFAEYGWELRDFSHIEAFDGDPQLFYDEQHPMPENQRRLIDELHAETR